MTEIPNAQADRPLAAAVCSIDSLPTAGTRSLTQSAIDCPLIAVNVSRAGPRVGLSRATCACLIDLPEKSVPRAESLGLAEPDTSSELVPVAGANPGANGTNDFARQADECGQAAGELKRIAAIPIIRYRYRGTKIPTPWVLEHT